MTLALAIVGCGTRGNGELAREARELGDLHGVDVGGVFVLRAERADDRLVELEGDANLLPHVQLTNEAGVLHARTDANLSPKLDLVLHVRSPELNTIELSGAARGEITGIAGDAFELEVSGASEAHVAGDVGRFALDVSGASDVDGAALIARDVKVEASGASDAKVTANVSLDAEASGASDILWGGTATQVTVDASGASTIERRPEGP
jgi:putative autotransporter adhesin-like protein